jgi:hypothetical protein
VEARLQSRTRTEFRLDSGGESNTRLDRALIWNARRVGRGLTPIDFRCIVLRYQR